MAEWIACDCETCRGMCERRPCWPTPEEAQAIIANGLGAQLMRDYWFGDGYDGGDINLLCPAGVGYEGTMAPFWPDGLRCVFLTGEGRCKLHGTGYKPMEGRLALCGGRTPADLHFKVATLWNNRASQLLVANWLEGREPYTADTLAGEVEETEDAD